jgi:hypothetical protein
MGVHIRVGTLHAPGGLELRPNAHPPTLHFRQVLHVGDKERSKLE